MTKPHSQQLIEQINGLGKPTNMYSVKGRAGDSKVPSEEMCHKARGFIMGLDLGCRTWGAMQKHLDAGGYHTLHYIQGRAANDPTGHITKWDVAECIYMLMNLREIEGEPT